jgi:MoaA/NifB/PqqE/SkfB family radical SAM enzyme
MLSRFMNFRKNDIIQPRSIRLEASTVCQLKCPSCPNAAGEIAKHLGRGFLKFEDFKNIIDRNPWVSHIELSNWGEIFLNKELITMMQYAHRKNVALSASNGANFNNVPEELLEGLVRYKFRAITCSIDGANAETYPIYRVNGNSPMY